MSSALWSHSIIHVPPSLWINHSLWKSGSWPHLGSSLRKEKERAWRKHAYCFKNYSPQEGHSTSVGEVLPLVAHSLGYLQKGLGNTVPSQVAVCLTTLLLSCKKGTLDFGGQLAAPHKPWLVSQYFND